MAFKLYTSKTDQIRFISSLDNAVKVKTKRQVADYQKYLDNLDDTLLTLSGRPLVFLLRPLTWGVYEIACRDARGMAIKDLYTDAPTARELLRLSVESFENWPKEWGDMEDVFSFEYKRKVLSAAWIANVPTGICSEAAKVLLDTLPLPEADAKEEDQTGPFPEKESRD